MQKYYLRAFTTIEIIVAIAIISIIAFWVSRFDFNRISQVQQIDIDISKLISNIEEVRNNALVGKAVLSGGDLEAPSAWEVRIEHTWSGSFNARYSLNGTFSDAQNYNIIDWSAQNQFGIVDMECRRVNGTIPSAVTTWTSIQFRGSHMELRCDSSTYDSQDKILVIRYGIPSLFKTITFNTLTGVIEAE